MRGKKFNLIVIIIILVAAITSIQITGCAKPSRKPAPKGTTKNVTPVGIDRVKNSARDIIKEAGKDDWQMVGKTMETLKKDWSDLKIDLNKRVPTQQINKLDSWVIKLNDEIIKKEKRKTQDTANAITNDLADLQGNFDGKVPPEMSKLGYYLREIVLGAEHNKMQRSVTNMKSAEDLWEKIKGQVKTNTTGEINFQDKIDSLRLAVKAKQKKNIIKFGNQSVNALDKLKIDYKK